MIKLLPAPYRLIPADQLWLKMPENELMRTYWITVPLSFDIASTPVNVIAAKAIFNNDGISMLAEAETHLAERYAREGEAAPWHEVRKGRSNRDTVCIRCERKRPANSSIFVINQIFYCNPCGKARVQEMGTLCGGRTS